MDKIGSRERCCRSYVMYSVPRKVASGGGSSRKREIIENTTFVRIFRQFTIFLCFTIFQRFHEKFFQNFLSTLLVKWLHCFSTQHDTVWKLANYGNSLSRCFGKKFVKTTHLVNKSLKSWFDGKSFSGRFIIFLQCAWETYFCWCFSWIHNLRTS